MNSEDRWKDEACKKKKKKVEESQGRNAIHLTPFPILNFFLKTCKPEYIKIVTHSWDLNGSE